MQPKSVNFLTINGVGAADDSAGKDMSVTGEDFNSQWYENRIEVKIHRDAGGNDAAPAGSKLVEAAISLHHDELDLFINALIRARQWWWRRSKELGGPTNGASQLPIPADLSGKA